MDRREFLEAAARYGLRPAASLPAGGAYTLFAQASPGAPAAAPPVPRRRRAR